MSDDERVSLSEIVEVRDAGFNSAELLAIIFASCEHLLTKQANKKGLFSPNLIYITNQGRVQIEFLESVLLEYTPPELIANPSSSSVNDPQVVWCLGEIVRRVSQADCADADLFSLINVMTVGHEPTRPTIQRLLQMTKNKIGNPEGITNVLLNLFQEVMGDIEILADGSDIESVATVGDPTPIVYTTKMAQMTRTSTSVSSTPAVSTTSHSSELQSLSSSDESSLVETREPVNNFVPAVNLIKEPAIEPKQAVVGLADDASSLSKISEESMTSRSISSPPTPIVEESENRMQFNEIIEQKTTMIFEKEETVVQPLSEQNKEIGGPPVDITQAYNSRTNTEPVEVEIHHESSRPSTPLSKVQPFEILPRVETTPVSARRRSSGIVTAMEEDSEQIEKKPSSATQSVSMSSFPPQSSVSPSFSRHNSLQSNQIRRRSTARRNNRKTISIPEFVEKHTMIRLRAQSQKRRKMSLLRVEDTLVLVKLLNGQSIQLNCRSDVLVLNIFDTIVSHLNITEHSFFSLAILKGSEFYFLDNDQRLEKFAPAGWKTVLKNGNNPNFSLYLRFKFYPKRTEFVRNETTMHLLYLQLRQDILSGILTAPNKQFLLNAGSIALQAEFSDKPQHITEYFDIHNYLPSSMLTGLRADELKNIQNSLVQSHSTHAGSNRRQSERTFIQLAQTFPSFGAHFYAVYKLKPPKQKERGSILNDIQNIQLIAIMPHGVGICRNAAQLQVNSTFEWPFIRTLQYDGKRFLIATIENNIAIDHVFYTDHFTKSRYLVRFAADQHRFMLRMRQWQSSLMTQSRMPIKDIGVDESQVVDPLSHSNQEIRQQQRPNKREDIEMTSEYIESCYGSDAIRLNVTLEKLPSKGLGLTLVDGSVNSIKGVYVKSVALDGDGYKKGIQSGDQILRINGVSLFNKSRHDAVDLVKDCEREVHLEILRFHSITAVLSETLPTTGQQSTATTSHSNSTPIQESIDRKESKDSNLDLKKNSIFDNSFSGVPERSRTPPAQQKSKSSSSVLVQKRQRAISDFGAVGDTLPKMDSRYLLASMEKLSKPADSESSDEDGNEDLKKNGAYNVNEMYVFHRDEEIDLYNQPSNVISPNTSFPDSSSRNTQRNGNLYQQRGKSRSDMKPSDRISNGGIKAAIEKSTSKNSNLDWTHDLSDIDDGDSEDKSDRTNLVNIQIQRIPGHSLGFKIASSNGRAYVKQVNSEPAISAKIRTEDRVVSINGQSVDGMNHQEIVNLLRNGGNVVRLVIERKEAGIEESDEEIITVVLDKSKSSSIGLSLAKRMGHDGIFIRNIVPGSLADQEGQLRVGDQVLMLNGEKVVDSNPTELVQRLLQVAGAFELVVRRVIEN